MEKKPISTPEIRRYWLEVVRKMIPLAIKDSNVGGVIKAFFLVLALVIVTGVLFILGCVPAPFVANRLDELILGIQATCIGFIVFLGSCILMLYRTPAEIHNQQESKIADIEEQRRALEEKAKPKLEIRLVEDGNTYKQITARQIAGLKNWHQILFRVSIHNTSSTDAVDGISVELSKTEPKVLD